VLGAALEEALLGIDVPEEFRTGRFVCVIAVARNGHTLATFHGKAEGVILHAPRGQNGFGYDPLFYYPPFGCSFGEAAPERKLTVSHRGGALRALFRQLSAGRV